MMAAIADSVLQVTKEQSCNT